MKYDDNENYWIDDNFGRLVRLNSQNHCMKLISQTPQGFFELFSVQERPNTDGGALLIRPKIGPKLRAPHFSDTLENKDLHLSIYPNYSDPDVVKAHFSVKGSDSSVDLMAQIRKNGRKLCFPIFGAIYAFPNIENSYRVKNHHFPHLVASYRPERCTLTAWLAISQGEVAIAVPDGWASYRYEFKNFSLHLLLSYIDCPSSMHTTFFPVFSDKIRLTMQDRSKFVPILPPNTAFQMRSFEALPKRDQVDFMDTMAGDIIIKMALGSTEHFLKAARFFEKEGLLIDGRPPREWFILNSNNFHDEPIDGPSLISKRDIE